MSIDDLGWLDLLAEGKISCSVRQDGKLLRKLTPTDVTELHSTVTVHELAMTVQGDFYAEYVAFAQSEAQTARVQCEARRTVVKFGSPVQFRTFFEVEFVRSPAA